MGVLALFFVLPSPDVIRGSARPSTSQVKDVDPRAKPVIMSTNGSRNSASPAAIISSVLLL
jgi:hypothetical protein